MNERIPTGGPDLVDLGPAVSAAVELAAATGIAQPGLELVGVRATAEGGVHHLTAGAMAWT